MPFPFVRVAFFPVSPRDVSSLSKQSIEDVRSIGCARDDTIGALLGVTEDKRGTSFISIWSEARATRLVGFSIQRADDLWPLYSGRSAAIPNQKRGKDIKGRMKRLFCKK